MMRVMMIWGCRDGITGFMLMDHEHLGRYTVHRVGAWMDTANRHAREHEDANPAGKINDMKNQIPRRNTQTPRSRAKCYHLTPQ